MASFPVGEGAEPASCRANNSATSARAAGAGADHALYAWPNACCVSITCDSVTNQSVEEVARFRRAAHDRGEATTFEQHRRAIDCLVGDIHASAANSKQNGSASTPT